MNQNRIIKVPNEYFKIICDICNKYHPSCEREITKENIDWDKVRFCNAMGSIKNRIAKANCGVFELEHNCAIELVDAVSRIYPNDGRTYPDEVEKLKGFLKEQTGRS